MISRVQGALRKVENFFLQPASPRPLAALRIALALILLAQAWMLRHSVLDLFSNDGFIQGNLASALSSPNVPKISWLVHVLAPMHVSESALLFGVCGTYIVALILLGLGLFTPVATASCWLLHWTLMNTGESTNYGVDLYAHVFLFYLIWMPAGGALSLDSLRKGRLEASSSARLGLRVLQLHLCISYFCSAIEKASGVQWWNGELLWRALSMPVYRQFDMSWIARWPLLSQTAGISSLVLEMGYCIFIWPKATRRFWVLGIVSLHLGIAVLLGLHLFGIIMALMTWMVFGVSAEPLVAHAEEQTVVLFDGECGLCDSFVSFVIRHDPRARFSFAPLQSPTGRELLRHHGFAEDALGSIVVIDRDGAQSAQSAMTKSSAVLTILGGLSGGWSALTALAYVPRPLRDGVYDGVAKVRRHWKKSPDRCMLMTPELKKRFL
jgi:predicted DCC family thiol-disulfide oxidoreductase YuxK